jgi:hypothetical protein
MALNIGPWQCRNLSGVGGGADFISVESSVDVDACGFVVGIERHNNGGSPQLREGGVRQAPRPRSDGAAVARALRASPSFAPVVWVNTHPT